MLLFSSSQAPIPLISYFVHAEAETARLCPRAGSVCFDLSALIDAPGSRWVDFHAARRCARSPAVLNAGFFGGSGGHLAEMPPLLGRFLFHPPDLREPGQKKKRHGACSLPAERAARAYQPRRRRRSSTPIRVLCSVDLVRRAHRCSSVIAWALCTLKQSLALLVVSSLTFRCYEDTSRDRETIQFLRELSARSAFPWTFLHLRRTAWGHERRHGAAGGSGKESQGTIGPSRWLSTSVCSCYPRGRGRRKRCICRKNTKS